MLNLSYQTANVNILTIALHSMIILNKIVNAINKTLIGWMSMVLEFQMNFAWKPRLKGQCIHWLSSVANLARFHLIYCTIKGTDSIQKILIQPLYHAALYWILFLFSSHNWTKFEKTYHIQAILIGLTTI